CGRVRDRKSFGRSTSDGLHFRQIVFSDGIMQRLGGKINHRRSTLLSRLLSASLLLSAPRNARRERRSVRGERALSERLVEISRDVRLSYSGHIWSIRPPGRTHAI